MLLALALVFGLAELVLWAAGTRTLLDDRDPFQGFSELVRVFQPDRQRGVYATARRAVQHSFNVQQFAIDKPAGGVRLFTLGGSSAYGFPWGGQIAFTQVLGEALQAAWPDRRVEAVNASGMSYASHRLRIVAHEVVDYRPDALIVFEGHNEFIERRFYGELLAHRPQLDRLRQLLYHSRVFSGLVRTAERWKPARAAPQPGSVSTGELLGVDVVREDARQTGIEQRREVAAHFDENLRAIVRLGKARGILVVLCTVPSNVRDWKPNQALFPQSVPQDAREAANRALASAQAALARNEAAQAAGLLEDAARRAPGNAAIEYDLGRAYEALGRWDDARASYTRARDDDAQPSRATTELNDIVRRVAREEQALLVDAEHVFIDASPHGLVGFNLIEDYVHPKPYGHQLVALALWKALLAQGLGGAPQTAPDDAFWKAVGGPRDSAVPAAAGAGGEAAHSTAAELYNTGFVLENQGHPAEAAEKYRATLAIDPNYWAARRNLAQMLYEQGRPDQAASEFQRVLDVEPREIPSLIGLGMALVDLGRPQEALVPLTRARELDPKSAGAANGHGYALAMQNRLDEAERDFRRAVELDPKHAGAWANLGSVLLLRHDAAGAIAAFENSLRIKETSALARNGLADAYVQVGRRDEAARLYREVLASNPADQRAQAGLARLSGVR